MFPIVCYALGLAQASPDAKSVATSLATTPTGYIVELAEPSVLEARRMNGPLSTLARTSLRSEVEGQQASLKARYPHLQFRAAPRTSPTRCSLPDPSPTRSARHWNPTQRSDG